MTGDDALISRAMSMHTSRMETAVKDYQTSVDTLRNGKVLDFRTLTDIGQIADRRQIVHTFLSANGNMENVVSNSEATLQADLTRLRIAPANIDATMKGYRSEAAPRNALVLEIRNYDDRIGQAMLAILDLAETNWGKWTYDPVAKTIHFEDAAARQTYRESLNAIKLAGQAQVAAQGELVHLK